MEKEEYKDRRKNSIRHKRIDSLQDELEED